MICKESESSEKEKDICVVWVAGYDLRYGQVSTLSSTEMNVLWGVSSQRYILF